MLKRGIKELPTSPKDNPAPNPFVERDKLRPTNDDPATEHGVLAVVVSQGYDCTFIRPKGRKCNALLKAQLLFDSFGVHEMRFGDMLVVDVARGDRGDFVTACRSVTDEEFESR